MNPTHKELVAFITEYDFELDYVLSEDRIVKNTRLFYEQLSQKYQEDKFSALLFLGLADFNEALSPSIHYIKSIATQFVKELSLTPEIETIRESIIVELSEHKAEELLENVPFLVGMEFLNKSWLTRVWNGLIDAFSNQIKTYNGTVEAFITSYNSNLHLVGRVYFHLVENEKENYPFAFLATYVSKQPNGKKRHLPLKNALIEYKEDQQTLLDVLSTVDMASLKSPFIEALLDTGEIFHPIGLSINEAFTFLNEIPLYEASGILCRIPNFWKNKKSRIKMSIDVGNDVQSKLNQEAILDFNIRLALDGESLTIDELRQLIASTDGLAQIKGKWVVVDADKLQDTLKAYEQATEMIGNSELSIVEAIRLQLSHKQLFDVSMTDVEVEVTHGQWLSETLMNLKHPMHELEVNCGTNFNANLRQYQKDGLYWLHYMKSLGLGACLADDMGLGKTIQVIALINYMKSRKKETNLLVVPASLIGNWSHELNKFAPSIKYHVIHPSMNKTTMDEDIKVEDYDLFITTYGMAVKVSWLYDLTWDNLILDEAQAIKNPQTKQTKETKKIKAKFKLALTGTPIENRLSDLWSLLDFLNKGLLGNMTEFKKIKKTIQDSSDGYQKLKSVVSPFILRRLKTDKSIINDLPDKIEMKTYATLSDKQTALYLSLIEDVKERLLNEEGIKRKGIILSTLMKFKQICNHPSQYLGQDNYEMSESGKFQRLQEICETIYEKRERVLVFTQFREMVEPLQEFLKSIFLHDGLILHGGTSVSKRKDIVDTFQNDAYIPFLVLSIKAGGVGLNLTKANHVIHFDRWWNPAVENQATDRAFRIGQQKNVIVHKFITQGTIEEKIDALIEEKVKIAQDIIPTSQENWLTEMNNDELMTLFNFSLKE